MTERQIPASESGQAARGGTPSERELVRQQLQARRDFWSHAFVYAVSNTAIVLICAITASGYFWPMWLIGIWGVGLIMHAWDVFVRKAVTEDDVDQALRKRQSRS
jgi:2TM domain